MAGTILIGGLFVLVFMGFPIAIALGLVCCLYSNLFGTIDMSLMWSPSSMEPTALPFWLSRFSFSRGN